LPTEDYAWEKNTVLQQQMDFASDVFSDPLKYGMNQALANLPKAVSYLAECVSTIVPLR